MADDSGYPTILIVCEYKDFRDILVRNLQQKGYLILEAQDAVAALKIVVRHSRAIHLLIADDRDDDRLMAATLKPYRPDMQVIHINPSLGVSSVLVKVSEVLDAPVQRYENKESSRAKVRAVAGEVENAKQEKKREK